MDELATRIFALLDEQNTEQKDFAESIGVVPAVVSAWRCGKSKSYRKYLSQISKALNTSVEYLLNGQEKPAPITESGLDATKYHMLNEENRALVDQMIEKLLKSQSGE